MRQRPLHALPQIARALLMDNAAMARRELAQERIFGLIGNETDIPAARRRIQRRSNARAQCTGHRSRA